MKKYGIPCKLVLAYAPMSNGKAERMAGTIKKSIKKWCKTMGEIGRTLWFHSYLDIHEKQLLETLSVSASTWSSVIHGVPSRFTGDKMIPPSFSTRNTECWTLELLVVQSSRVKKAERSSFGQHLFDKHNVVQSSVGEEVLVAKGKTYGSAEIRDFERKWYGPCLLLQAQHPGYVLQFKGIWFLEVLFMPVNFVSTVKLWKLS